MGKVLDSLVDAVSNLVDAAYNFVKDVWDAVAMPLLEEVFGWFGIEDETVVQVQSVTSLLFGDNPAPKKDAMKRAVMANVADESGILSNYIREMSAPSVKIDRYQKYGVRTYVHGLPDTNIKGTYVAFPPVKSAIDIENSVLSTVIETKSAFPTLEELFKFKMQDTHSYKPFDNTLTFTDANGNTYNDYILSDIVDNTVNGEYEINVTRTARNSIFSISSDTGVIEGNNFSLRVKSSLIVPTGEVVTVNLLYSGTAVDGVNYTSTATVDIVGDTFETELIIPTIDDLDTVDRTVIVIIDSVTNNNNAFEAVSIDPILNTTTTVIGDNDTPRLVINDVVVDESGGTASFDVELSFETLAPFTVDYSLIDVTALGGVDYDNTGGTLNFLGTTGEIQTIVVPITVDVENDDNETFKVELSNSSDTTVLISNSAVGTIRDFTDTVPVNVVETEVIIEPYFIPKEYVIAKYYTTVEAEWYYWLYDVSLNTYPDVKAISANTTQLEMLPIAILRVGGTSVNSDVNSIEYKTTKKLLKKISLDIDDLIASVEDNPDIALVKNAFVSFAVNPTNTSYIISDVLYSMFDYIVKDNSAETGISKYSATLEEGNIKSAVVWSSQSLETIAGSIGGVGDTLHTVTGSTLTLQKQLTTTHYKEIIVSGVNAIEFISSGGFQDTAVSKLGDSNFKIPLSYFVVNKLNMVDQLHLFSLSLTLTVQALEVTEIAWYETAAFWNLLGGVLTIISIAIFINTGIEVGFSTAIKNLVFDAAISAIAIALAVELDNDLAKALAVVGVFYLAKGGKEGTSLLSPESLVEMSTTYSDAVIAGNVENIKDLEDKNKENMEEADKLREEYEEAMGLHDSVYSEFFMYLQKPATLNRMAITAQYDFSSVYDYDILVKNFNKDRVTSTLL